MSKNLEKYQKILSKHGIALDPAELLEWSKNLEQLAGLIVSYEKRKSRGKDKGQDPPLQQ